MQVIPSVNAKNFKEAKEMIKKAAGFLLGDSSQAQNDVSRGSSPAERGQNDSETWIHIDIGDGIFTPNSTWASPSEFKSLKSLRSLKNLKTEVHLMVESPDAVVLPWLEAGAKRIIIHIEAVEDVESLLELCQEFQAELGLAISPDTSTEELNVYFNKINFYQVLAVAPGLAGQTFKKSVLAKIKILRQKAPNAIIEVDGGINLATAKIVKEAGADVVVSASYIWQSKEPQEAFKKLVGV